MGFFVLFEDKDLIAVVKPAGLVVDGGDSDDSFERLLSLQLGRTVFPFHRIDRATSGIVLFGKSRVHAAAITQAFEKKQIRKSYLAVVEGVWRGEWSRVDSAIEGKESVTTFRILGKSGSGTRTLIEALPKTGRKHQIRIHCASMSCPIAGDTLHGVGATGIPPREQALHAYKMSFKHPGSGESVSLLDLPDQWRETYLADFDWNSIRVNIQPKDSRS